MKIQVNTDVNISGNQALFDQISASVNDALAHFEENITRVEVHVSDESKGKSGLHDHRCMIEARIEGRKPIAVTDHAEILDQAVNGAAEKLAHALETIFGRLKDKRKRTPTAELLVSEPEPDPEA